MCGARRSCSGMIYRRVTLSRMPGSLRDSRTMEFTSHSGSAPRLARELEPPPVGIAPELLVVLLIEDDDGDALLVDDLLADSALNVRLVRSRSLREGLDRLPGQVDCVLLDLGLPDVVGMDTVRRVRAVAPRIA